MEQDDPSAMTPGQQVPSDAPTDLLGRGAPDTNGEDAVGDQADGSISDAIEDAKEEQALVPEAPKHRIVDEETKSLVRKLWAETTGGIEYMTAVAQWKRDRYTLYGDPVEDIDGKDPVKVAFPRILRNRDMTVALTMPDDHSVEWKPAPMIPDPNAAPGSPMGAPPQLIQFAKTLTVVVNRYADECHLQDMLEAWVREGASYRLAIMKVTWSSDYHTSAVTHRRPIDDQETHARLRLLLQQYQYGDFQKHDALYGEMIRLAEGCFGKSTLTLNGGFAVDLIPFPNFRISQDVRTFAQFYHARWMSEDIIMRRSEVLAHWPYQRDPETGEESGICPEDLRGATVYDDQGVELLQEEQERQRTNVMAAGDQPLRMLNDDDLLLVREIWSRVDQRVYVLVRGLEYFATEYVPENQPDQWYPYVGLTFTDHTERVYGISDTEVSAPIEREINDLRNDEAYARRAVVPRGFVDSAVVDEEAAIDANDIPPYGFLPIKSTGVGTFKDGFFIIPGTGTLNEKLYDTTKLEQDLDKSVMLPSQLQGDTESGADFSSEVQLAARGASILTKKKQTTARRAGERVYKMMAEYLLFNVGQAFIQQRFGPFALWPATHPERMQIYQNLDVQLKVSMDADLERAARVADATKLLTTLKGLGVPIDAIGVSKFLSHLFGEESDIGQIVQGNPASYVQSLVQGGQATIASLPLPLQQQLAQIGTLAAQLVKQQLFQQMQQQALRKAELQALQQQALTNLGPPPATPPGLDVWPGALPPGPGEGAGPGPQPGPGGPPPAAANAPHPPPLAGNAAGPHRKIG